MRILFINKYLYPKGGAETYMLQLGEYFSSQGHEVQYFGMDSAVRCVGNEADAYTSEMDFHGGSKLKQLTYPLKIIYSVEARKKLRLVLDRLQPEVIHINNFNFQLTPSILVELQRWRKAGHPCRIIYTAHDYQLICPNHLCRAPLSGKVCEKCLSGDYVNCIRGKCIHGSRARSIIGAAEAYTWRHIRAYEYIDKLICCSAFIKTKLDTDPLFAGKTVTLRNFSGPVEYRRTEKKDYVLYFGRYDTEKGIRTLLKVCRELPDVQFVFAGAGALESELSGIANIKNVGFKTGEELEQLIREARFSVYPSEWYENCPFSVIESLAYCTPVLGADIGGIPELISDGVNGELFESGNAVQLREHIERLWSDKALTERYTLQCRDISSVTVSDYAQTLMGFYSE